MGWVLFFDGDCAFCSASVRRVARLDRRGRIGFAPLQGKLAREFGFERYLGGGTETMVILREEDHRRFTQSDALIELARVLGGFWRLFTVFRLVPKKLRDGVYNWVALHRQWISKKGDFCSLPDPELVKRLRE